MDTTDRTLPHNLDAERAVLGAVMLQNDALTVAVGAVAAADFFRAGHRAVFEGMVALAGAGSAIDLVTLRDRLAVTGDLDSAGGPVYLAALVDGVPRSSNVLHYAGLVREKARLRDLIACAARTLAAAYEAEETPAAIVAQSLAALSAVAVTGVDAPVTAEDAVFGYMAGVGQAAARAYATGYADVDALIDGFRSAELTVVAARPSVGKSAFALGAAAHIARQGVGVAYFSPDQSVHGLAARLLAAQARVPNTAFERGTASPAQYGAIGSAAGTFAGLPLWIDGASRTVGDFLAWCRRLKQEHDIQCVVVDFLQKLRPDRRGRSREEEVAGISADLKALGVALSVAVVALSQLGRSPDDRRDKRPHLSDLRESGAIEQDADCVILLHREEMHAPRPENAGIAEAIVAKQRNGPTGVVRLCFNAQLALFDNLAPEGTY